jgi:hypothetical protein
MREIEVEMYWEDRKVYLEVRMTIVNSSPVHVAPLVQGPGKGPTTLGYTTIPNP